MSSNWSAPLSVVRSEFTGDSAYADLLEIFTAALPDRIQGLRTAFEGRHFESLRVLAHQLKGAGGGFGFPGVTDLAAELERASRSADIEAIRPALDRLIAYLGRIAV
ncbi:MAG: Hpt domain-containing protein [Planctomycetaceae bacterium]